MKWPTFLGMLLLAGWRYLLVGILVLTIGYVGVESWQWMKQNPPTKAVEQAVEPPVKSYRTDKHEAEWVFYNLKPKIAAL